MIFTLHIFTLRLRRTIRDYRAIWRPDERPRYAHLKKCWRASDTLIVVDRETHKIYEVP